MSREWHQLSLFWGLLRLIRMRRRMREDNLHDTEPNLSDVDVPAPPNPDVRTTEGTHNDKGTPAMGRAGARFGRNAPLDMVWPDTESLLDPNPRVVSNRLMARSEFKPATILNLLAAAWIQFQVHDWLSHGANEKDDPFVIDIEEGDDWPSPTMEIRRTRRDPEPGPDTLPPTFRNTETHWWDGSQVYGSTPEIERSVRALDGSGKLKISSDGRLLEDPERPGVDLTGVNGNYWVGLSLMHTLFTLEHNAICDAVAADNPSWGEQEIYDRARLTNAALMAKIHTVDWTPSILPHPTTSFGVRGNWWGARGEIFGRHRHRFRGLLRRLDLWSGVPGSRPDHHAAPYSLTEEFVAVYRMHPLVPDVFTFHALDGGDPTRLQLEAVSGPRTRSTFDGRSVADVLYSFGLMHPGAITLRNYPDGLRRNVRPDGRVIDIAAIDILRDRERGVPRYNDFREMLRKKRLETFEELTDDPELAEEIRDVYDGDIDKVDTMVGLFAEPLPAGFGFSETAFRIFLLMASRRLKSDRFYSVDYRPEIYSPTGLEWVESNDMKSVLLRHFPQLAPAMEGVDNAFKPWKQL